MGEREGYKSEDMARAATGIPVVTRVNGPRLQWAIRARGGGTRASRDDNVGTRATDSVAPSLVHPTVVPAGDGGYAEASSLMDAAYTGGGSE